MTVRHGWQERIFDTIARCEASGRKPVCLVINPLVYEQLVRELAKKYGAVGTPRTDEIQTVFGLLVLQTSQIEDFQVIDNRSWVDQKF